MDIETETTADGIVRIALTGRMDIEGTQSIELKLAAHTAVDRGAFLLDLSGVSFLASMGIRALIVSAKAVRMRGGRLAIYGPDEHVTHTLRTAGIDALIPLCEDFEAARTQVRPA